MILQHAACELPQPAGPNGDDKPGSARSCSRRLRCEQVDHAVRKRRQVSALAVSAAVRSTHSPEVPTLAESLPPGFVLDNWSGLFAPAGLPAPIARCLFEAVAALQASGIGMKGEAG
ncbi:tripartite tricarboxylate transporter substrate-binding protein [Cupriavidus sp. 2KB_3]|nr:tripartite tricarboxylate transporter substrate-binding protein [Cupriavidus campinensis]